MNKELVRQVFPEMVERVEKGYCPTCDCNEKIKMEDFRDELSVKEYKISGMCQDCQDRVFNG